MTQKEIRDLIEQMIQTNSISENAHLSLPKIPTIDLYPVISHLFNKEAHDVIQNRRVFDTIVQYNAYLNMSEDAGRNSLLALCSMLLKFGVSSCNDPSLHSYTRSIAQVRCYGLLCERKDLADASMQLVNFFNDLASKKLIRGVLVPLSSFELADGRIVVVSYLAVDDLNLPLVNYQYGHLEFPEGGIPLEFK